MFSPDELIMFGCSKKIILLDLKAIVHPHNIEATSQTLSCEALIQHPLVTADKSGLGCLTSAEKSTYEVDDRQHGHALNKKMLPNICQKYFTEINKVDFYNFLIFYETNTVKITTKFT